MAKDINSKKRFWNYLKDPEKRVMLLEIIFYGVIWGSLVNYSLMIFGVPFKLYLFPAYGISLYLFKSQVVRIWRNLFFKYEDIGEQYR